MKQVFALNGVSGCADVDPIAGRRGDSFVSGFVEAAVTFDDSDIRMAEPITNQLKSPVCRTAVHDEDFVRQVGPGIHRIKVPSHQWGAVIGR